MTYEKPILAIIGPTAVGKTAVAITLAQQVNGEIIGLDSRQIYKGLDIGTAQPSKEEMELIPHHLVAVREPNELVSAGGYAHLVEECIHDISDRGKNPILCGGAGLYLEALTKGIFEGSASDLEIRARLNSDYDQDPEASFNKLEEIDPDYAEIVHINNKKRLVRALEIYELTGKPPSVLYANQPSIQPRHGEQVLNHAFCVILLSIDKDTLEKRIRSRTQKMLANGWIEETKILRDKYSVAEAHALDSIGYRQIGQHLRGEYSLAEVEEEIIVRTRQYAKRQMTWFRNRSNPVELDVEKFDNVKVIADEIISIWKKFKLHPKG
ncbi:MAG: tRNA (adenosine(37)-N6)-dimethylallyltransferase MiaA [Candidatus Marinimicrobia bacterium]|nr:tRNA (adenosine(37)-N6)-dimethylallyltransferase MiaA [Candidatus Neomarinimicrobiota bacterium]